MRFHVLGVGSIGTLVSHHLRQTSPHSPISLITKSASHVPNTRLLPYASSPTLTVEREGLVSTSTNYEVEKWHDGAAEKRMAKHGIAAPVNDDEEKMKHPPNSDIQSLIVCLKTTSTIEALSVLRPRLSPSSVITLVQNGMGVFDELCASLWPDPTIRPHFILGTTTHGARRNGNVWSIQHATKPGFGDMRFGIVPDPRKEVNFEQWIWGETVGTYPILDPPPIPPLPLPSPPKSQQDLRPMRATLEALLSMNQLSPSLLPMPHLHHQLLLKLAINSVINPLTAVLGGGSIPNGALFGSAPGHRLIRALTRETTTVITAYLHSLSAPHSPAPDVIRLFSANSLESRILSVIRSTAENTSSMATDVSNGRLTEIAHINGYLISLAKRLGVETPNHQMVYEMVRYTSEINGLSPKMPIETVKRVAERRTIIRKGLVDMKPRTPVELEMAQRQLELEERKVWIEETKLREQRAERRAGKRRAAPREVEGPLGDGDTEFHPSNWEEKSDKGKSRYLRKVRRRAEKGGEKDVKSEKGVVAEKNVETGAVALGVEEEVGTSSSDIGRRVDTIKANTSASADSIKNAPQAMPSHTATSPASKPAIRSSSWMNDLIASAPRQERTWDVPAVPPTARGPLPKKRDVKVVPSPPAPIETTEKARPSGGKTMMEMMSSMIDSAPRQTDEAVLLPTNTGSSASSSSPTIASRRVSSEVQPPHTSPSLTSSLDSLISSAPRALRDWDVKGGTISGYTGSSSSPVSNARTPTQTYTDLSRGGLGSSLDGLIASSPRQERTWGVRAPIAPTTQADGGRFTTSRTSGS